MRLSEPEVISSSSAKVTPLTLMQLQDSGLCPVMIDQLVDCMDLWDLACGRKGIPQDKSQRLAVLAIREERRTQRIRRFVHLTTRWMLADLLTKWAGRDSDSLLELLSSGSWTLRLPLRIRHGFGNMQ